MTAPIAARRVAVALLLLACLSFAAWQFRAARQSAREGAAIAAFVTEDVLGSTDALKHGSTDITRADLLDHAVQQLPVTLHDQPRARATIALALGKVYETAGKWAAEEALLQSALMDAESVDGAKGRLTLRIVFQLAMASEALSQWDRADVLFHRILASTSRLGESDPLILDSLDTLAYLDYRRGFYASGAERYEKLLARLTAMGDSERVGNVEANIADLYSNLGRHAEAEAAVRKALAYKTAQAGAKPSDVWWLRTRLGWVLLAAGRYADAAAELDAAQQGLTETLGPEHPYTLAAREEHARALLSGGDAAAALPILQSVYAIKRRVIGDYSNKTDTAASLTGRALAQLGRAAEAVPLIEKALDDFSSRQPATHPATMDIRANLAEALLRSGDREKARKLMAEVMTDAGHLLPPDGPRMKRLRQVEAEVATP